VNARSFRALLVAAMFATHSGLAACAPEVGWWWNPAESGRGFFIESHDGVMFMAGYFYESDGRATWLVSGGSNADPYAYSGRLLAERAGQTLTGPYQPPTPPVDSGAVSLHFTSDTQGTLTWPGGTVDIVRQRFGGEGAPFQPDAGWWWNPEESGRGYSVELQGDKLFAVAFMYDAAGNPVWYYSAGTMTSPSSYDGPWLQFSHGQTQGGAYRFPDAPVPVGRLHIDFTAIDEAWFTISDDVAPPGLLAKGFKQVTVPAKRQFTAKPTFVPAERYDGNFTQKTELVSTASAAGVTLVTKTTTTVVGKVTWIASDLASLGGIRGPRQTYFLMPDLANMPIKLTAEYSQNGAGLSCAGSATKSFPLADAASTLDVNGYGQYKGTIELGAIELELTYTCKDLETGESFSTTLPARTAPHLKIDGPSFVYGLTGDRVTVYSSVSPTLQDNDTWSFAAVKKP
jgi:hypothetical protein